MGRPPASLACVPPHSSLSMLIFDLLWGGHDPFNLYNCDEQAGFLPTTYKTRWRGLDILKLQYMPYMRETFNLKATHFILRGNTCSYSTTSNADSPLSMLDTSVSYHLYLLLICVMFTLLLDRWAPVGEDRRKACSYLSDSGAEGRCYIHVTPALSCMKSLRAVKHLVTVWLLFPISLKK